ncbi:hypothetical protein BHM03_00036520, partial [Ensete ventricosum]
MRAPQRSPISRKRHEGGPWSAPSPFLGASPCRGPGRSTPFPSLFSLVTPRSSGLFYSLRCYLYIATGEENSARGGSIGSHVRAPTIFVVDLWVGVMGGGGEEASRVAAICEVCKEWC